MAELLIRPSLGDHKVLADLLAPNLLDRRPIDRLVLNAHDASRSAELGDVARQSGTPLMIDPLTFLLQEDIDPGDRWVAEVPFARAEAMDDVDLAARGWQHVGVQGARARSPLTCSRTRRAR